MLSEFEESDATHCCDHLCQEMRTGECAREPAEFLNGCADIECEAHPCRRNEYDPVVRGYVSYVDREGHMCEYGDVLGWCDAGEYVPEPVECAHCRGRQTMAGRRVSRRRDWQDLGL